MKLNSDLGESYGIWSVGLDDQVMPHIHMANIACGFHASDPDVMAKTVKSAIKHNVSIGAHPGYDDKKGFGRRSIPHTFNEIKHSVMYQVGALRAICQLYGTDIQYVKPHGALYNDMMRDESIFTAIVETISESQLDVPLMILAKTDNSAYAEIAKRYGVRLLFEAFADRAYNLDGSLVDRRVDGAVHHDTDKIIAQVQQLVRHQTVTTLDGQTISLNADTICVHGDNQESIATVAKIRSALDA